MGFILMDITFIASLVWIRIGIGPKSFLLSMGVATRNLGASVAPLLLIEQLNQRSIINGGLGFTVHAFLLLAIHEMV